MVEGVKGSSAFTFLTGPMTGRYGESDCRESVNPHDTTGARRTREDHVSLTGKEVAPLTDAISPDSKQVQDCAFPVLRQLVSRILQDQHTANRISEGELESTVMDTITSENAKALAAVDGHWQPDQTAGRIISFALTISGNNQKKIDNIKENIISGFQLAVESFGGELPEISARTYTAIMNGLHQWADNQDYSMQATTQR